MSEKESLSHIGRGRVESSGGGQRRLLQGEDGHLNQEDMRWKGEVPGAVVKGHPREVKTLGLKGTQEVVGLGDKVEAQDGGCSVGGSREADGDAAGASSPTGSWQGQWAPTGAGLYTSQGGT